MDRSYWHKQTPERPLFADLLWSRPENRRLAGKLLIVGGNAQSFVAPAEAYTEAGKAGVGTARVLLPDYLLKTVSLLFPEADFAPSTPSGSFSQKALADLLELGAWSDGMLLCGDLGRNSETAILLEYLAEKYSGQLTLAKDAADYFLDLPGSLLSRPNTLLVLAFGQLQKLAAGARFPQAFKSGMGLLRLIDMLHEFTARYACHLILRYDDQLLVASDGQICTTLAPSELRIWRLKLATHAATWWLQNPANTFEALCCACLESQQKL